MTPLLLTIVLSQVTVTSTIAEDVKYAVKDANRIGAIAARTRYLTMYNIPEKRRLQTFNVASFAANSLSKEADIVKPRLVTPTLIAIVIDDYGWDAALWEKLATVDPYFHAITETSITENYYEGQYLKSREKKVRQAVLSPILPLAESAELVTLTQSQSPILRADWWLSQVLIQAGRNGVGYYDWLGIKDRDTYQAISFFDQKASQKIKREVAAIVSRSGVAQHPRQIFRLQSLTGGYWFTKDTITDNKDDRNALRNLDDTYKHEAEEHYSVLPNGLFVYLLCDEKGKRQDSAPDGIGSDETAPGKDKRIHIFLSCVRCHTEGLRPIDDWGRKVFQDKVALSSPDYEKSRRLFQLYLSDIADKLDDDRAAQAKIVKRLTGYTTPELSAAVAEVWSSYAERDLTPADAAKDLGVTEEEYLTALRNAAKQNPLFDPVLSSHLATPAVAIRSDDWEQVYQLALSYLGKK